MPGIEFLKDWELKKHGWPALIVAIIFTAYELFAPKDPSCTQEVKFLQSELTISNQNNRDLTKTMLQFEFELERYKKNDSAYRKVIDPYKPILNKK